MLSIKLTDDGPVQLALSNHQVDKVFQQLACHAWQKYPSPQFKTNFEREVPVFCR